MTRFWKQARPEHVQSVLSVLRTWIIHDKMLTNTDKENVAKEYALKWRVIKRFLKWLGKRNAVPKQRLRLSPSQRKTHRNWEWQREEVESMQASRRNLIKTSWSAGELRLAIWKTQIFAAPEPEAWRSFRKGALTGKFKCNLGRRDDLNGFCCVLVCRCDCMYTTHCSLVIHTNKTRSKAFSGLFFYKLHICYVLTASSISALTDSEIICKKTYMTHDRNK